MPVDVFAADPHSLYYTYALRRKLFEVIPMRQGLPTRLAMYQAFLTPDAHIIFFGNQAAVLDKLTAIKDSPVMVGYEAECAARTKRLTDLIPKIRQNLWLLDHPFDLFCADNSLLELEVHRGKSSPLETRHDTIQLMFPTTKQTEAGKEKQAILLSRLDIEHIKSDPSLQKTLLFDFAIMMKFYGFHFSVQHNPAGGYAMKLTAPVITGPETVPFWAKGADHNDRRITRILRSLSLCGLDALALRFLTVLKTMQSNPEVQIPAECYTTYWSPAVDRVQVQAAFDGLPTLAVQAIADEAETRKKIVWANFCEMLQVVHAYQVAHLPQQQSAFKKFGTLFTGPARHDVKVDAVAELYKVMTAGFGQKSAEYNDVSKQNREHLDIMLQTAAMARGYLQIAGDITAGKASELCALLEKILLIADATQENRYSSAASEQRVVDAEAAATAATAAAAAAVVGVPWDDANAAPAAAGISGALVPGGTTP